MQNSKHLYSLYLIVLAFLHISLANAHSIEETTSRVTLRDGQVEIRLYIDMERWQATLQDNQAWLLGEIDQIMPAKLTPVQKLTFMRKVLADKTSISLNDKPVALRVSSYPIKTNDLLLDHVEIVLLGRHKSVLVDRVNIKFPKSLGAVYTSFVKPKYRMIAAGSIERISLRSDTHQASPE